MEGYLPAIGTFIFGALIGYLGQRGALCFVGGMRDFYLIRDTWLIKGLLGFLGGSLIGFIIFSTLGMIPFYPWILVKGLTAILGDAAGSAGFMAHFLVTIIGGIGVGFLAIIQGGCPFRNFVMAAEGNKSAMAYAFGLIIGAILFHLYILPFVQMLL
ncbi:YeeE/YedE family protein [Methanothermococcus sp. SCGC AD-155-M21]|nr:YeeE/YedE family protein [Methanothermococcus sp. SCGC AD-155-M21]